MTPAPTRLAATDVRFAYGDAEVLRGVSLAIDPGEIVGIVGPNGAGKSTLLRLLAGLLAPRGGSVLLGDRPVAGIRPAELARIAAFVPQESRFPFPFRALELVLMGRAAHLPAFGFESRGDVAIARAAMERTDCAAFAGRPIDELSGGERQRVILARALAQEPRILLLDEPTAFLDIRHQVGLHRALAEDSRRRGTTVVAAMHDLNLAAAFCRRIVMLADGAVAADGSPADVFTAETVRAVFGADVAVGRDEATGRPYCLPL